jgi:hypothetical protein
MNGPDDSVEQEHAFSGERLGPPKGGEGRKGGRVEPG